MYENRTDAGRRLATRLMQYRDRDPIVVALPRGGVPVAYEVARALGAPLDVLLVRKIGAPHNEEVGIGAIAEGNAIYLNDEIVRALDIAPAWLDAATRAQAAELTRRLRVYRRGRSPLDVAGRTVILVDDGLATGATTRAAVRALRKRAPREIILAVPVCAAATANELRAECDGVVCPLMPSPFRAVGLWYADFAQTTDEEVVELLERAERERSAAAARPPVGHTP